MFASDYADGIPRADDALAAPHGRAGRRGKIAAHWAATGLPLTVLSPLLGLQYGLDADTLLALAGALALGTPLLSLLGAACSALTLGARGGGVLLALLALPLFVPVLDLRRGRCRSAGGRTCRPRRTSRSSARD